MRVREITLFNSVGKSSVCEVASMMFLAERERFKG